MKTRITELVGIEHPIMLAGMNWITQPKLVAAVCSAGGLGVLGIARFTPEETRENIRETKALTDRPFGINQTLNVPLAKDNVQVAIEEKVPVINYSLGRPWFIEQVHKYGGKVLGTIATVKHAIWAKVPLIAAGGFYDGRGLAEALVLGADAVSMGTRFMLTSVDRQR